MIKPSLTTIALLSMVTGQTVSQELPPPYLGPPPLMMAGEHGCPPLSSSEQTRWWIDPQAREEYPLVEDENRKVKNIVRDRQMQGIDLRAHALPDVTAPTSGKTSRTAQSIWRASAEELRNYA